MITEEGLSTIRKGISTFGRKRQSLKVIEELSELLSAITKSIVEAQLSLKGKPVLRDRIAAETADAYITLGTIREIYGITDSKLGCLIIKSLSGFRQNLEKHKPPAEDTQVYLEDIYLMDWLAGKVSLEADQELQQFLEDHLDFDATFTSRCDIIELILENLPKPLLKTAKRLYLQEQGDAIEVDTLDPHRVQTIKDVMESDQDGIYALWVQEDVGTAGEFKQVKGVLHCTAIFTEKEGFKWLPSWTEEYSGTQIKARFVSDIIPFGEL